MEGIQNERIINIISLILVVFFKGGKESYIVVL